MNFLINGLTMNTAAEITQQLESALEQARKIAADDRFTPDAKARDIAELTERVINQIEGEATPKLADLEAEITRLELAAAPSIVPDATEIQQAAYTRDVLVARWATMSISDAIAAWGRAIEAGNQIEARVWRDFYPNVWREKIAAALQQSFPGATAASTELSPELKDLTDRTDDLLSTEAQREARAALATMRERHADITNARDYALSQLRHARFDASRGFAVDVLKPVAY